MGTYYTYAGSPGIYFSSKHSHVWVSPFPFGVLSFVLLRSLNSNFLTYSLPAIIVWLKIDLIDHLEEFDFPVRQAQAKEASEFDFLTVDLKEEIELQFPSNEDKEPTTGRRLLSSLQEKAGRLFPVGRVWANCVQLTQALSYFWQVWAVSTVHSQKKIRCHFGQATKEKEAINCSSGDTAYSTHIHQSNTVSLWNSLFIPLCCEEQGWPFLASWFILSSKNYFCRVQSPLVHDTSGSLLSVDTFR